MYQRVKFGKEIKWVRDEEYIIQRVDGLDRDLLSKAMDKFFRMMQAYIDKYGECRCRLMYYGSISDGQESNYWNTTWYGAITAKGLAKTRIEFEDIFSRADYPLALYGLPYKGRNR